MRPETCAGTCHPHKAAAAHAARLLVASGKASQRGGRIVPYPCPCGGFRVGIQSRRRTRKPRRRRWPGE